MHTKNAKPHDAIESAYLADVKRVGCVACAHTGTTDAHHPRGCQGLHFMVASLCELCHGARVWDFCGMTETQMVNETRRRVDELRTTGHVTLREHHSRQHSARAPVKRAGSDLSSTKQLPRF
jgi:hypothetical protein